MTPGHLHAESDVPSKACPHDLPVPSEPCLNQAPKRPAGYLVRHWRGEFSLWRALWFNGILALLVPGLLSILVSAPPAALRERPGAVRVFACLWFLAIALRLVSQLWWNVGLWHSAKLHVRRGGQQRWAYGARAVVVAAVVLQLGGLVYIARTPYLVFLQILLGRDPHGHATFQISPDGKTLLVSGKLGAGFATELTQALHHAAGARTLQLNSDGGRLYEAIAAAKEIRALRLNTHVIDHCNSGCTVLFLAGQERTVATNASLGFHKPILGELDGTESDVEAGLGAMKQFGVPETFLARIRTLTARQAWYPTVEELLEYKVITSRGERIP